jgi:hypothetical protein
LCRSSRPRPRLSRQRARSGVPGAASAAACS